MWRAKKESKGEGDRLKEEGTGEWGGGGGVVFGHKKTRLHCMLIVDIMHNKIYIA